MKKLISSLALILLLVSGCAKEYRIVQEIRPVGTEYKVKTYICKGYDRDIW